MMYIDILIIYINCFYLIGAYDLTSSYVYNQIAKITLHIAEKNFVKVFCSFIDEPQTIDFSFIHCKPHNGNIQNQYHFKHRLSHRKECIMLGN